MNLARLNHILIPTTAEERDRWRRTWLGTVARPGWTLYTALSDEGRALSILVLFVGAASVDVGRTQIYFLWSALVGLLGAGLIVRRWFRLDGVVLRARMPRRVGAFEAIPVDLELRNTGAETRHNVRVRGPFLPWDGSWRSEHPSVRELRPGRTSRVETTVAFVQRGWHHLDAFHACQVVPFGVTLGPRIESGQCKFLVVPRIAPVARLTLPDGGGGREGDLRRGPAVGYTTELAGVRPYRVGDPVRDLHAKTWARTGEPHVREYEQVLQRRVAVVFAPDPSASEAVLEAAVSLAAGVVSHLFRRDVVVDLVCMDGGFRVVPLGKGVAPFERALDALATVDATPVPPEQLARYAGAHQGKLSSVVVVSASRSGPPLSVPPSVPSRTLRVVRKPPKERPRDTVISLRDLRKGEPLVL